MIDITLGQKVRDKVTGFEGIATARIEYINGCIQFCVKPKMTEEGKMPEGEYIDQHQLDVLDGGKPDISTSTTGGPIPDLP